MTVVPVADWMPDAAALGNPGAVKAENVLPGPTGYKPFPSLEVFTNALDARPRGALSALDDDLVTYLYAGDTAKLYSLSGSTWSDVSKGGGYSTGTEERWEFVRWRDQVLATNYSDNPQAITMSAATFADLTTAFRCRHLAVVRDFVVAGNTFDSTDSEQIDRVRWCAFGDPTDWTVSSVTGADVRNLNAGDDIKRIFGGEYGVILSGSSVWRMSYVGAPTWFRIDEVLPGVGLIAPGAAAQAGDDVYFLSRNGFVRLNQGQAVEYIGAGRVDQTVLADLDNDNLDRVSAVFDPQGNRIIWAYPGSGNTGGRANKLVIYDRGLNKWSAACFEVELLWSASGVSTTLEQLDSVSASLDDLGTSLDSSRWKGGAPGFAGFDSAFKHGLFSGSPMTAVVETRETEVTRGGRTTLTAFRALSDGGSVSARVGVRSNPTSDVTWVTAGTPRNGGRIPVRASGRYHRFELTLSGEWTDVIGAQVDASDAKVSGVRG